MTVASLVPHAALHGLGATEGGAPLAASDLTVLIPAFNEEEGLPPTLETLLAEPRLAGARIIVIDDGSTDKTAEVVREIRSRHGERVEVLRHKNNQGYGAGIKSGTRHATTRYVAWFDADGQHRTEDLVSLYETAGREHYDAVFGKRTADSAFVRSRVLGKKVLSVVANSVANQKIPDLNCGLRVFRRELLAGYLPLLPDGFSASTTTTLLFIKRNRHFSFEPITVAPRVGTSTVKQVRDGLRTLHLMMRILFLFQAFKTFAIVAGLVFSTGFAYGITIAILKGQGFPVLAELLVVAGVIIFCFGIVSDQISALRIDLLERSDAGGRVHER
jgi:glycosyltransferase involved in cell wall biosynthesis